MAVSSFIEIMEVVRGPEGLRSTLDLLRASEIASVGAGANREEAARPYLHQADGGTVAILNVAENEFSIAGPADPGANPLDPVANFYAIQAAAAQARYVIVIVHGGHERFSYPSRRMIDTYRFFVDAGAHAVIGHHAHCYSGVETYRHAPIFYGLGNFIFDRDTRNAKWNYGYAVQLTLGAGGAITHSVVPYVQGDANPGVRLLTGDALARFERDFDAINDVIRDPARLAEQWDGFVADRAGSIMRTLLPMNSYLTRMYLTLGLPLPLSRTRTLRLLNTVRCESHRDVLLNVLKNISR